MTDEYENEAFLTDFCSSVNEYLLKNFLMRSPRFANRTVARYYDHYIHELIFILDDGTAGVYDDLDETSRRTFRNLPYISDDEFKREFGLRLSKIIWYKTTQVDLSAMTGISQTMISHYITGKCIPSVTNVMKLADALECPIGTLTFEYERKYALT